MKWWTLIKGYAANEFAHDADEADASLSAAICAKCPSLKVYQEDDAYKALPLGLRAFWKAPPFSGWCGEPGVKTDNECGCLVMAETDRITLISVKGKPMEPAGKTTKSGFKCPQKKWSNP